ISASQKSHIPVGKPQGIMKQQAVRKSARLQAIQQLHKQSISKSNHIREVEAPPSPPASKIPEGRIVCASTAPLACRTADLIELLQRSQILHKPSKLHQKRKRGREA